MSNDSELMIMDSGTLIAMNNSEIEQQVTTAHKFPRSIKKFRDEALQMVTLNEAVAQECIYALPRDGKTIEGPSARFAEVMVSAWGNSRSGARVISDSGNFVTSQGVFHDLEKNVAITIEVQRRITTKHGKRFGDDMIGVTGNAANSIAFRNAVLKGIPKAFWSDLYEAARRVVMGDFKTLANRRAEAIQAFTAYGVTKEQICAVLGVAGVEDIGLEKLVILRGLMSAIRSGDTTPEEAFAPSEATAAAKPAVTMPQAKTKPAAKPEAKTAPAEQTEQVDQSTGEVKTIEKVAEAMFPLPEANEPPADMFDTQTEAKEPNHNAATDGEKNFIKNKANALGISLADAMSDCGLTDFDGLTKDGFIVLKDYLNEMGNK